MDRRSTTGAASNCRHAASGNHARRYGGGESSATGRIGEGGARGRGTVSKRRKPLGSPCEHRAVSARQPGRGWSRRRDCGQGAHAASSRTRSDHARQVSADSRPDGGACGTRRCASGPVRDGIQRRTDSNSTYSNGLSNSKNSLADWKGAAEHGMADVDAAFGTVATR